MPAKKRGRGWTKPKRSSVAASVAEVADQPPAAEYVVEGIVDKRVDDGRVLYLVKWKDYPVSSTSIS
jgi:hypothetical protein